LLNARWHPLRAVIAGGQVTALRMGHVWSRLTSALPTTAVSAAARRGSNGSARSAIPRLGKYAASTSGHRRRGRMTLDARQLTAQYLRATVPSRHAPSTGEGRVVLASASRGRPSGRSPQRRAASGGPRLPSRKPALSRRLRGVGGGLSPRRGEAPGSHLSGGLGRGASSTPWCRCTSWRATARSSPIDQPRTRPLLVELAGGLYHAPASVVNVVPVLRVDGRDRSWARGGRAGKRARLDRGVAPPGGGTRRVDNRSRGGQPGAVGSGRLAMLCRTTAETPTIPMASRLAFCTSRPRPMQRLDGRGGGAGRPAPGHPGAPYRNLVLSSTSSGSSRRSACALESHGLDSRWTPICAP